MIFLVVALFDLAEQLQIRLPYFVTGLVQLVQLQKLLKLKVELVLLVVFDEEF